MQLLEWWNLIFELPFLVSFLTVLAMATGMMPAGDGDGGDAGHDLNLDHDIGHDLGHDVGHDMGHDAGHDVGHDVSHETGEHGDHSAGEANHQGGLTLLRIPTLLGIGKVPMALILMSLSVVWGFIGWTSNQLLSYVVSPVVFVPISILLALVCAFVFTRYVALFFARLIPSVESYSVTDERLLGKTGEARYAISEAFGEALVRDRYGQLHQVSCRTLPGNETIPSGSKVVLYQYDSDHDLFYAVTPLQFEILTSQIARTRGKEL